MRKWYDSLGTKWFNIFGFFFSSRRRHTRFDCDWSSDVCSSDLLTVTPIELAHYASILATRGKIWRPRVVAAYRDPRTGELHRIAPVSDGEVPGVTPEDWQRVVHGMIGVVTRGTAAAIGAHAAYSLAG